MLGLLLILGLVVGLVALDALVRRVAGDHPHFDGRSYESHLAGGGSGGPWAGGGGGGMDGGFGGDCGGGFGGDCGGF